MNKRQDVRLALTLGFAMAIVVLPIAQGQPGQGGTAQTAQRRARVKALKPSKDSDLVLPEVLLATDGTGRSRFIVSEDNPNGERTRRFSFVDPTTGEFHAYRLTGDPQIDARRILREFAARGMHRSERDLIEQLADTYRANDERDRQLREQAGMNAPQLARADHFPGAVVDNTNRSGRPRTDVLPVRLNHHDGLSPLRPALFHPFEEPTRAIPTPAHSSAFGPAGLGDCPAFGESRISNSPRILNAQWVTRCTGYGWANSQTWEPAAYLNYVNIPVMHLNQTNVQAWWGHVNGAYDYVGGNGSCWANQFTFIGTVWNTLGCWPHQFAATNYFQRHHAGHYRNTNFFERIGLYPGIPIPIYVYSVAKIQGSPGFVSRDTDHYEDISAALQFDPLLPYLAQFLLTEVTDGRIDESCSIACEPSAWQLSLCEGSGQGNWWDWYWCDCHEVGVRDPLIIDLDNDGLPMTSVSDGIVFDMNANGVPVQTSWTQRNSNDGFLVLDRNGNGRIDDSTELFSDVSPQPSAPKQKKNRPKMAPNGFLTLGLYDESSYGGNGDNQISDEDAIYRHLRLWIDANHNGASESSELTPLDQLGIRAISLHFVAGKEVDEFGNRFGYRGHVIMDRDLTDSGPLRRRAYDVFLQFAPLAQL